MRKWVFLSIILAFVVIVLGAYTRLTDAGLGCPDWPGCYGHLFVPTGEAANQAQQAFPERPIETGKAWNEMIHRYFAGSLGLFILFIFIKCAMSKDYPRPLKLPLFLVILVGFQATLGMLTVTMNLMPLIVMGHLLGGFSVLACLYLLYLRLSPYRIPGGDSKLKSLSPYALLGLFIVIGQIALGGWVSANYAALACTSLPICEGNWLQSLDFANGFSIPEADNYEYGSHAYHARMTMHIMHRFGAIITFTFLAWLSLKMYISAASLLMRRLSVVLICVLGIQILLGVSNIVFMLPLGIAVAHNFVAACLLLVMVHINYTLYRKL